MPRAARQPDWFSQLERRAPSDRPLTDAWLTEKIKRIHDHSRGVYGAPRIHAELRTEHDLHVGRKRIARLMKAAGIAGVRPRKRYKTTIRIAGITPATDLVERRFRPDRPNVLWVADITYPRTGEGWLYLAAVQDTYSRQIVGWAMATHMRASLVVDALNMALSRRRAPPGLIHHADQGSPVVYAIRRIGPERRRPDRPAFETPPATAAPRSKSPSTSPGGRSRASERAYAPRRRSACRAPCGRLGATHAKQTAGGDVPTAASRLPLRAVGQRLRAPLLTARTRPATDHKQRGAALGTVALPTGATVGQSYLVCVSNRDLCSADASTLRSRIGRGWRRVGHAEQHIRRGLS